MAEIDSKQDKWSTAKEFIWNLWDGMVPFSQNDNKVDRIKEGTKPRWFDRFFNKRWVVMNFSLVIVGIVIFFNQYDLLGKIKLQQLNTEYLNEFNTEAKNALKVAW